MSSSNITEQRQRICDLLGDYVATLDADTIARAKVHRYLPRQLNATDLPAFIVLPANATHQRKASDLKNLSRLWRIQVYVAPTAQGIEGEIEASAETYLDTLSDFLDVHQQLRRGGVGLNGVQDSLVESDTGIREGQYPFVPDAPYYLIVEIGLRVISSRTIR